MFFLGIAGPFIPYFLMMGILIAITLEASLDKLNQPEKESHGHHLRIILDKTTTKSTVQNYFFIDRSEKIQAESEADPSATPHLSPPGPGQESLLELCGEFVICSGYVLHYSGLSPPSLFVS